MNSVLGEEGSAQSLVVIFWAGHGAEGALPGHGDPARRANKEIVYVFQGGKKMRAIINLNNKDYKKKQHC